MRPKLSVRGIRTGLGCMLCAGLLSGAAATEAQATTLIKSDLEFVLQQIKIAEAHAAGGALSGTGANQISNPLFPYGLRTVDGEDNNLIAGPEAVRRRGQRLHAAAAARLRAGRAARPSIPTGPGPRRSATRRRTSRRAASCRTPSRAPSAT